VFGALLDYTTIFLPGNTELKLVTDLEKQDEAIEKIFADYPIEIIVLKQGKKGADIITKKSNFYIPAVPIKEVDPTGAGDCFDAGFLCAYSEGLSLKECGKIAASVGAANAAVFGPMEGDISRENAGLSQGLQHD